MSVPPTFIDCDEATQTNELKVFLKNIGIKGVPSIGVTTENWPEEFVKCVPLLSHCFTNNCDDLDCLLMTVVSLVLQLPPTIQAKATDALCKVYQDNVESKPERVSYGLYSLDILFRGVPLGSRHKYTVFMTLLNCAHKIGVANQISTHPAELSKWLNECNCTEEECCNVWRKLFEVHQQASDNRQAVEAMMQLLQSYSEQNASKARSDAIKCILAVVQDPTILAHEQLLSMQPVQFLEGEPIHDFLQLFISSDLEGFEEFVKRNPKFMAENSLNESACLGKIRILTFMQLCENRTELDYDQTMKALKLKSESDLQNFVIDVVRQRVVACKLDQLNRKIYVAGAVPRSFGHEQWSQLLSSLQQWRSGLNHVHESLNTMLKAEVVE